jgi:hypothetical protein
MVINLQVLQNSEIFCTSRVTCRFWRGDLLVSPYCFSTHCYHLLRFDTQIYSQLIISCLNKDWLTLHRVPSDQATERLELWFVLRTWCKSIVNPSIFRDRCLESTQRETLSSAVITKWVNGLLCEEDMFRARKEHARKEHSRVETQSLNADRHLLCVLRRRQASSRRRIVLSRNTHCVLRQLTLKNWSNPVHHPLLQ